MPQGSPSSWQRADQTRLARPSPPRPASEVLRIRYPYGSPGPFCQRGWHGGSYSRMLRNSQRLILRLRFAVLTNALRGHRMNLSASARFSPVGAKTMNRFAKVKAGTKANGLSSNHHPLHGRSRGKTARERSKPLIAVFGSSQVRHGDPLYAQGIAMGDLLGRSGFDVMTGGYKGV